jgi:hypothetical protein
VDFFKAVGIPLLIFVSLPIATTSAVIASWSSLNRIAKRPRLLIKTFLYLTITLTFLGTVALINPAIRDLDPHTRGVIVVWWISMAVGILALRFTIERTHLFGPMPRPRYLVLTYALFGLTAAFVSSIMLPDFGSASDGAVNLIVPVRRIVGAHSNSRGIKDIARFLRYGINRTNPIDSNLHIIIKTVAIRRDSPNSYTLKTCLAITFSTVESRFDVETQLLQPGFLVPKLVSPTPTVNAINEDPAPFPFTGTGKRHYYTFDADCNRAFNIVSASTVLWRLLRLSELWDPHLRFDQTSRIYALPWSWYAIDSSGASTRYFVKIYNARTLHDAANPKLLEELGVTEVPVRTRNVSITGETLSKWLGIATTLTSVGVLLYRSIKARSRSPLLRP